MVIFNSPGCIGCDAALNFQHCPALMLFVDSMAEKAVAAWILMQVGQQACERLRNVTRGSSSSRGMHRTLPGMNHGMVHIGKEIKTILFPPPALGRDTSH